MDMVLQNTQIPIIDISDTASESRVAGELVQAAIVHGFVYIKNLGNDIHVSEIDHAFELSQKFFSSPIKEKEACMITENNHGWGGMHTETLDAMSQRVGDFKDEAARLFNFGEPSTSGHFPQPLPASLSAHEQELQDFFTRCHSLCLKLLTLFGLGLQIDPSQGGSTWFTSRHQSPTLGPSGCTLRLLYYPSIPENSDYEPDIDIRAGAHSDYGSITLLFQRPGQPGLEILTPDRVWSPVPVFPPGTEEDPSPPILVNIGDLLSYWTNGLFKSTVHRVVFPKEERKGGEDRYSIAFFCHPVDDSALEAVPSEMVTARARAIGYGQTNEQVSDVYKGKGAVITAREHLLGRLKATYLSLYKDKGDEAKETT